MKEVINKETERFESFLKSFRENKEEQERYKRITALISRCSFETKDKALEVSEGYSKMYRVYKKEFKKTKSFARQFGYYEDIKKILRDEDVIKELEVIKYKYELTAYDMTEVVKKFNNQRKL